MIIVEGPGNSGKTTLLNQLNMQLGLEVKDPFTPHPGDDLMEKVLDDLRSWSEPETWVYDGYPLIQEYIYGPLNRKKLARGFDNFAVRPVIGFFWSTALIVYCRPPDEYVENDPALHLYDIILDSPLISAAKVIKYNHQATGYWNYLTGRIEAHHQRRMEIYGE